MTFKLPYDELQEELIKGDKKFGEMKRKNKDKFNKLQQEQRDLDESYQQSKRNKKERDKS
jgi:hypothetical protein